MRQPLRVLIVEDRADDAELMVDALCRSGFDPKWDRIETEAEYLSRLRPDLDVILCDYSLPTFDSMQALVLLLERRLDIPFIVVTGSVNEEVAVECMKRGASDYLLKDRLTRLGQAVRHALEQKRLRSARRIAEEALLETEARFHAFLDNSPVVAFLLDEEMRLLYANQPYCRQFKIPRAAFGKKADFIPPEFLKQYQANFQDALARGETIETVETYPRDSGELGYGLVYKFPLRDATGRQLFGGVGIDITERKRAEESLRQSEARMRAILETALDCIITIDQEGRVVEFNPAAERTFGYQAAEILGRPLDEMIIPPAQREAHRRGLAHYLATGEGPLIGRRVELSALRADGSEFPVELSIVPAATGGRLLFTGFIRDITERKRAEEQLRASLREKETLLKEVHHRVKNNLAIIDSFLSLQTGRAPDGAVADTLRDSRNRVHAMAYLHETLYNARDLAHIDFRVYVQGLCNDLWDSFGVDRSRIQLSLDLAEIHPELDLAVPLGLLLNELLTNTLKHGFPDGRQGRVSVTLQFDSAQKARLLVADNGVGLPGKVDFSHIPTVGLRLVHSLSRQINGSVEYRSNGGTTFIVFFPLANY